MFKEIVQKAKDLAWFQNWNPESPSCRATGIEWKSQGLLIHILYCMDVSSLKNVFQFFIAVRDCYWTFIISEWVF